MLWTHGLSATYLADPDRRTTWLLNAIPASAMVGTMIINGLQQPATVTASRDTNSSGVAAVRSCAW